MKSNYIASHVVFLDILGFKALLKNYVCHKYYKDNYSFWLLCFEISDLKPCEQWSD